MTRQMRRAMMILAAAALVPLAAGQVSGLSDYVDRGEVSGQVQVSLPGGVAGFRTARLTTPPVSGSSDFREVELSPANPAAPSEIYGVPDTGQGDVLFTGSATLDVSGLSDGTYALFVWGCDASTQLPTNCRWLKPYVFEVGTSCTPQDHRICHEGDAYWADSCGNRGEVAETCGAAETCSGGQCVDATCDTGTCTWEDVECGGSAGEASCGGEQMLQERTCTDGDCTVEYQCVSDPACTTCTDECDPADYPTCSDGSTRATCVEGADGCHDLEETTCSGEQVCSGGSCVAPSESPTTTITGPAGDAWQNTDFSVAVSDGDPDTATADLSCDYRIDAGADGSWEVDWTSRPCDGSFNVGVGPADTCSVLGADTCRVETRVEDPDGNAASDTRDFDIDHRDPSAGIDLAQGGDAGDTTVEANIDAGSAHSPLVECTVDWTSDGSTDATLPASGNSFATTETHEYGSSGTYTAELACEEASTNLGSDTATITVPGEAPLDYTVVEDLSPDTVTDRDVFTAQVRLETNAEEVAWRMDGTETRLYDDGSHDDGGAGDGVYGNIIDAAGLLGDEQVTLIFRKDGETATEEFKTVTFRRTPASPVLDTTFNASGVYIDVTTGFPAATEVDAAARVTNGGTERLSRAASTTCDGSCTVALSLPSEDGDTAHITVNQTYEGLASDDATTEAVYSSAYRLNETEYVSATETNRMAEGSLLILDLIGISHAGFAAGDIADVYLTRPDGTRIGTVRDTGSDLGYIFAPDFIEDLVLTPERMARWNATIPASGIPGDSAEVTFNVELSDGTTLSHPLGTFEVVEDTTAPEVTGHTVQGYPSDGEMDLRLELQEDYQSRVDCTVRNAESGAEMGDCSVTSSTPAVDTATTTTLTVATSDTFGDLEVEVADGAGNARVETVENVLLSPDTLIDGVETHGNPRNKVAVVVYGHLMDTAETRSKLDRNIDYLFGEGDFSSISEYRDMFNWYVVDTERELCGTVEGSGGTNCPDGRDTISTAIEYADVLKGSRAATVILDPRTSDASGEWIRSFAALTSGYTIISEQDADADPFSHEMMHMIWAFNDEYASNPADQYIWDHTHLFPDSMASDTFRMRKYPNVWHSQANCEANVTAYYAAQLDLNDCYEQRPEGYIIQKSFTDTSIMKESDEYRIYPNHKRKIEYWMENNPTYE